MNEWNLWKQSQGLRFTGTAVTAIDPNIHLSSTSSTYPCLDIRLDPPQILHFHIISNSGILAAHSSRKLQLTMTKDEFRVCVRYPLAEVCEI